MREHSRDYGRLEDILKYARNVLTKCQTLCEQDACELHAVVGRGVVVGLEVVLTKCLTLCEQVPVPTATKQVARPLYIGDVTTLQPIFKKTVCKKQ